MNIARMQTTEVAPFSLSSAARLGRVGLIVSSLQRSLDFYQTVIGLNVLERNESSAQLGIAAEKRVLLQLEQRAGVRPLTGKRLGLYHFALLLPSRADLSSFAEHLQGLGVRAGMSDHRVSEAFYLDDPDGLQIEVVADHPSKPWEQEGEELAVGIQPLDLRDLLNEPHRAWSGAPSGSRVGHIHLYVGDIPRAERLYRHGLGMNVRTRAFPGALFLAAGKYHHHVGLNTWAGNVPVASESDARLRFWELAVQAAELPALKQQMLAGGWSLRDDEATENFEDPWGIVLRLVATH